MRITRHVFMSSLVLRNHKLIAQIVSFPEHGMGYSLVDVILKDGILMEQVLICNGDVVCFYDNMRQFSEDEIGSVTASKI